MRKELAKKLRTNPEITETVIARRALFARRSNLLFTAKLENQIATPGKLRRARNDIRFNNFRIGT